MRIHYEARLAKIDLKPEERPKIDPNFEEVTEDAEESTKESLGRKWAHSAQAQIRVLVRRILRKYGCPPDKQEKATQTVLEQAKLLCAEWTE